METSAVFHLSKEKKKGQSDIHGTTHARLSNQKMIYWIIKIIYWIKGIIYLSANVWDSYQMAKSFHHSFVQVEMLNSCQCVSWVGLVSQWHGESSPELTSNRNSDPEAIMKCIRWYIWTLGHNINDTMICTDDSLSFSTKFYSNYLIISIK